MEKFFGKLAASLRDSSLVKVTLSKPADKNNALRNIYIKPILLKNNKMYQFVYHYERRDETKNFSEEGLMREMYALLPSAFMNATMFTLDEDVTLLVSKKGKPTVMCKNVRERSEPDMRHDHEKSRLINPTNKWWNLLGLATGDGKVVASMQHKFKQICKYVEIVDAEIRQARLGNTLRIADMGAGKGYLTFALFEYLTSQGRSIDMEGVEIRPDLVEKINGIIEQCSDALPTGSSLRFVENSIEGYEPKNVDVIIALHACDTATDDAILKGIRNNAKMIVCAPCCHKQIRCEMEKSGRVDVITRYGIFLERQAVMITDAVRALVLEYCGYKTRVMEFIEMEDTPKNVLLVGRKSDAAVDKEKIMGQIQSLLEQYGIQEHYLWKKLWRNRNI
ncbi:MAG: class I SAM-dependent methyltransferase [Candidatus Limimorpha sp.]